MYLQRESFLGVEQFDQQRKPRGLWNVAENVMSILRPKFVQRFSFERSACDNALRLRAIDNFPRFADASIRWQFFSELRVETASAPHSLHEDRLEGERRCHCGWRIVDCRLANAKDTVV